MKIYVALLRGINVGGNRKLPMAALKTLFEEMGYCEVQTYINSGNVLFRSSKKPSPLALEDSLEKAFGFKIPTIVRDHKSMRRIARYVPNNWQNDTEHRTEVFFLWEKYDSKKTLSLIKISPVDTVLYTKGTLVWHVKRSDYGRSGLRHLIGTDIYKHMTARNINTLRALLERMS